MFVCSLLMVKLLMGCKKLRLTDKNKLGQDAACLAAIHGQLPILKYLLRKHEDRLPH